MIGSRIANRVVLSQQNIAAATLRAGVRKTTRTIPARTVSFTSQRAMSTTFHGTSQTLKAAGFTSKTGGKPRVVVLGCGWGGMKFLYNIDQSKYDVTLIAPRDHMLFTPLLAGSAVGTLESRSVIDPVRPLLAKKNFEFIQATAQKVDTERKVVVAKPFLNNRADLEGATVELPYDYLIVGVGAEPATFGIPGTFFLCYIFILSRVIAAFGRDLKPYFYCYNIPHSFTFFYFAFS